MKRICLILFFLIGISIYSREFVIAGIEEAPTRFFDEENKLVGIDIDIIKYVMEKMDIEYKIIIENSSARLENNCKEGLYDMVFSYSYNNIRAKYLIYPQESHLDIKWNFFIRKEDINKIHYNDFSDFRDYVVGVTVGFSYTPEFWEAVNENIFVSDKITENKFQLKKLMSKRIDILPYNTFAALYDAKRNKYYDKISYLEKPLKEKKYYNTLLVKSKYQDKKEFIKKYDEIIKEMKSKGLIDKIIKKYTESF